MLWGSNWPHTASAARGACPVEEEEPFRQEDDGANLALLHGWLGEKGARHALRVAPVLAFGFDAG